MMYYWNIYTGEDIYEVEVDSLLDLFNTKPLTSVSGGLSLYGSNAEEKVWFALIDAGYSAYSAAGVMGNLAQESGFKSNNMQDSYQKGLGMNDETYTAAVDNGTYDNFVNDSVGYGLAQWTDSSRKAKFYAYIQSKGVSISDLKSQIEFLLAEMDVTESSDFATFNFLNKKGHNYETWFNATSATDAAISFCYSFERAGKSALATRTRLAEEYYQKYKDLEKPTFGVETIEGGNYVFPHYLQGNYSGSYGTSTISKSACGPTSLSMILAGVLGDPSIDPVSVVENIKAYWPGGGYYVPGKGSSHCIFSSSFLQTYYGVTSLQNPSATQALQALESGYPVVGGEDGHILALIPVTDELKAQGYKFYIMDSGRGHDGAYRSVEEANKVITGNLRFLAIIYP